MSTTVKPFDEGELRNNLGEIEIQCFVIGENCELSKNAEDRVYKLDQTNKDKLISVNVEENSKRIVITKCHCGKPHYEGSSFHTTDTSSKVSKKKSKTVSTTTHNPCHSIWAACRSRSTKSLKKQRKLEEKRKKKEREERRKQEKLEKKRQKEMMKELKKQREKSNSCMKECKHCQNTCPKCIFMQQQQQKQQPPSRKNFCCTKSEKKNHPDTRKTGLKSQSDYPCRACRPERSLLMTVVDPDRSSGDDNVSTVKYAKPTPQNQPVDGYVLEMRTCYDSHKSVNVQEPYVQSKPPTPAKNSPTNYPGDCCPCCANVQRIYYSTEYNSTAFNDYKRKKEIANVNRRSFQTLYAMANLPEEKSNKSINQDPIQDLKTLIKFEATKNNKHYERIIKEIDQQRHEIEHLKEIVSFNRSDHKCKLKRFFSKMRFSSSKSSSPVKDTYEGSSD